eukprot:TRINITY_DN31049_c0_g1_i1.p1 TRINITY_DN31049_c0_g1~~TRINITY_DN31049_c0_g1_i1.p1  ORF type:complete len:249 (-),score=42.24 TRINITY_DN31049_c0_g1_i1:92-838(-)
MTRILGLVASEVAGSLERSGAKFTNTLGHYNSIVPHEAYKVLKGKQPTVGAHILAPNSSLQGDVIVGERVSFGFNCIIRADAKIVINHNTHFQDGCIVSTPVHAPVATFIGKNVIVGTGSSLQGCTVEDNVHIGARSSIGVNSIVQQGATILPGSVVPPNTVVTKNQVWGGKPAKFIRDLTTEEAKQKGQEADNAWAIAQEFAAELKGVNNTPINAETLLKLFQDAPLKSAIAAHLRPDTTTLKELPY